MLQHGPNQRRPAEVQQYQGRIGLPFGLPIFFDIPTRSDQRQLLFHQRDDFMVMRVHFPKQHGELARIGIQDQRS